MMRLSIPSAAIASAVLLSLSSGVALAQSSNTLTILQQGSGNTLTVDQSGASGSRVGGLEMDPNGSGSGQLVVGGVKQFKELKRTELQKANGDETEIEIIEIVPIVESSGALLATFDREGSEAAQQLGRNNTADVTITGIGGFVGLLQDNSPRGSLGNDATIQMNGNGTALVGQQGDNNTALLSVSGARAFGEILQRGSNNNVGLTVAGVDARGSISQLGSNNETALAVTGAAGSAVSYVLQGNDVSSFNPSQGVEVMTNAATVTITQTQY